MSVIALSFYAYWVLMVLIGVLTYKVGSESLEGYFLGKRSFGPFTIALTHQATAMSGYMFQGMPGKGFTMGLTGLWTALGSAMGPLFGFNVVAKRLRRYTERVGAITVPDFLATRYYDRGHTIRFVSVIITLTFMVAYVVSQNVAIGLILESTLGLTYKTGVIVGALCVLAYTFLGGFYAVVWTDVVQGLLMFVGAVLVPVLGIIRAGGVSGVTGSLQKIDPKLLLPWASTPFIIGVLSNCLGYLGQPQLMVRYMAMKDPKKMRYASLAASVWAVLALYGVTIGGMVGRVLVPNVKNPEMSLFALTTALLHPVLAGVLVAAAAAAIMSSANSFLLVGASNVASDLYFRVINPKASQRQMVTISRIVTLAMAVLGILWALNPSKTVFQLVLYAWSGLACSFGPVTVLGLFWKRTTREGALAGMIVGCVTVIAWNMAGLSWKPWYEMLPGLILATLATALVSLITPPPPSEVQELVQAIGQD